MKHIKKDTSMEIDGSNYQIVGMQPLSNIHVKEKKEEKFSEEHS